MIDPEYEPRDEKAMEQTIALAELVSELPMSVVVQGRAFADNLANMQAAAYAFDLWSYGVAAREALPKGSFVIWSPEYGQYVAYVLDENSQRVDPPVPPQYADTSSMALIKAMAAYYKTQKESE